MLIRATTVGAWTVLAGAAAVAVVAIYGVALALVWSLNTLFGLGLPYGPETALAALLIVTALRRAGRC